MRKKLVILGIDHGHYKKIIEAAAKHDDAELSAIAHETDNSAIQVAKEYNIKLYDSYEKCLDQEQPDIVGIAMFNGDRGEWVIECLQRKISIIADKPICTNFADITRIEDILLPEIKPFAEQFFDALMNNNEAEMPISKKDIIRVCKNILS